MSRYVKDIEDGRLTVAYGFDHVTGYFFQVFDNHAERGEDLLIIDQDSYMTGMSNGDMLSLMEEYGADSVHKSKVALDLPF